MSLWVDLLGCETRFLGTRYRTRIAEVGTGPVLLLLHGTGGHLENYARNIMPLAAHFRVVALDFLWHGLSQTDGFDPEILPTLVDQVVDVMDTLGVDRAAAEGQSLGGWVAMQFALRHPMRVAALILTTTQGYVPDDGAIPGYVEPDWSQNLPSTLSALSDPSVANIHTRMARILADPSRLTDEAIAIRQALYVRPALAAVQADFNREYLGGGVSRRHVVTDSLARTGDMICMIANASRPNFTTGGQCNADGAEKAGAYQSMLAYSGTFRIEGDTLYIEARLEAGTPEARTAQLKWTRCA